MGLSLQIPCCEVMHLLFCPVSSFNFEDSKRAGNPHGWETEGGAARGEERWRWFSFPVRENHSRMVRRRPTPGRGGGLEPLENCLIDERPLGLRAYRNQST